jgi:5-methylcytosine-specific restriction endonuclease McrA
MVARELDRLVRERAGNACEYCRMSQSARRFKFPIDHIIAQQHHGPTTLENLALACGRCNRHKGPNLAGVDPLTGRVISLFNPRRR